MDAARTRFRGVGFCKLPAPDSRPFDWFALGVGDAVFAARRSRARDFFSAEAASTVAEAMSSCSAASSLRAALAALRAVFHNFFACFSDAFASRAFFFVMAAFRSAVPNASLSGAADGTSFFPANRETALNPFPRDCRSQSARSRLPDDAGHPRCVPSASLLPRPARFP